LSTGRTSGHRNLASIPLYSTWMTTKMGGVQPVVPHGQPYLPTRNRMMGNPAKLQNGVPVIMKVIDLTKKKTSHRQLGPLRGSSSPFSPLSRRRLNPIMPVHDPYQPDGRLNLAASAFNRLGQLYQQS